MKRNLWLFLMALMLPYSVFAHDFIVDGICYNVISKADLTCEVTFNSDEQPGNVYRKFYKDVVFVPEKVSFGGNEYSVIAVGEKAFAFNDELLSVVLPKTIVSIGHDAFSCCPEFKSLTIPENVQDFNNISFHSMPSLEYLAVDENNEFFDSREGCNAIIKTESNTLYVACKNTVIPDGVKVIADGAFLTFFSSPIQNESFELVIPKSVETIERQAFAGCGPLKKIVLSEGLKRIGHWAFNGTSIESIVIPASVLDIDNAAFYGCDSLKVIKVNKGNRVYDSRKGCNAIIETESDKLVQGCASSAIPQGVKVIGRNAFWRAGIKKIEFPSSVELIEDGAFRHCSELKDVVIPGNVKEIKYGAFELSGMEELIVEEGVEFIAPSAFRLCKNLKLVSLPESLKKAESSDRYNMFEGCRKLERVKLPNGNSVYYCNGDVLLERETRKVIAGWGIDRCSMANGLRSMQAKKIGFQAFAGHELLAHVVLPETLEEIESEAFRDCKALRAIVCRSTVPPVLGEDVFEIHSANGYDLPLQERAVVVVPKGSLGAYRNAPGWKDFKHIIELK